MTVREPEFSEWDRAVLLADLAEERAPRGSHGVLLSEAMDPKNQFAGSWVVEGPMKDWAEIARRAHIREYEKQNPGVDMTGLHFRVRKKD
ncbi:MULTISPECIES: hypothetical protein [unclassified Microbacterium]|uniref:hypothetical protein n=1 Tax=unclassified Microbacterium TaxID=2609290 RepID=UPI00300FB25B